MDDGGGGVGRYWGADDSGPGDGDDGGQNDELEGKNYLKNLSIFFQKQNRISTGKNYLSILYLIENEINV